MTGIDDQPHEAHQDDHAERRHHEGLAAFVAAAGALQSEHSWILSLRRHSPTGQVSGGGGPSTHPNSSVMRDSPAIWILPTMVPMRGVAAVYTYSTRTMAVHVIALESCAAAKAAQESGVSGSSAVRQSTVTASGVMPSPVAWPAPYALMSS